MNRIQLDLTKLLGFRIINGGPELGTLHSPKIGAKQCPFIDPGVVFSPRGPLSAKIGAKTG
jgi:hypothetical protein